MSGFWSRDIPDFFNSWEDRQDLESFAAWCDANDMPDVAGEVEDILCEIAAFDRRVGVRWGRLTEIARRWEWLRADKGTRESLDEAVVKYRRGKKP